MGQQHNVNTRFSANRQSRSVINSIIIKKALLGGGISHRSPVVGTNSPSMIAFGIGLILLLCSRLKENSFFVEYFVLK